MNLFLSRVVCVAVLSIPYPEITTPAPDPTGCAALLAQPSQIVSPSAQETRSKPGESMMLFTVR